MKPNQKRYFLIFGAVFAGIATGLAPRIARNGHVDIVDLIVAVFIVLFVLVVEFFLRRNNDRDSA
jgi:O-antigen/teichoic acid export membrane protein